MFALSTEGKINLKFQLHSVPLCKVHREARLHVPIITWWEVCVHSPVVQDTNWMEQEDRPARVMDLGQPRNQCVKV